MDRTMNSSGPRKGGRAPPAAGRRPPSSGFTLIEVLAAVAVLAIALSALISGMARYADNAARLRDKSLAFVVAHNRLTEIELQPVWPKEGRSDGDV
jgi:general secretion pathway protein I